MEEYTAIADRLAADIMTGRLRAGDRLPTHRDYAYTHHLAVSTVSRAYRELRRRSLVVGEVGRGTFVRDRSLPGDRVGEASGLGNGSIDDAVPEGSTWIDLEQNYCLLPEQSSLMEPVLHRLVTCQLAESIRPVGPRATPSSLDALLSAVGRQGWEPEPEHAVATGSGRQALAAALAVVAGPGRRIGIEASTYPVIASICRQQGVDLVTIETDEAGPTPTGIEEARRTEGIVALYLQPTLHNPTTRTMPSARRAEIAEVLDRTGLHVVEDAVYSFLRDDLPLAAFAPSRVFAVDSLSKRLAPGLTAGVVVAPPGRSEELAAAVRGGGWSASRLALMAISAWMEDGTVQAVATAKRSDAADRQRVVAELLGDMTIDTDPSAYHCWWHLPAPWRPDTFVAAAARRGIACTPAAAFTPTSFAPRAVRLALASPAIDDLRVALSTLGAIARRADDDVE